MAMTMLVDPLPVAVRISEKTTYMVGGDSLSVDWRWPKGCPAWRMSDKEGVQWFDDGPLNEAGRQLLLRHFGLESIATHLPLEVIAEMSPATLAKKRRSLERRGLPRLDPVSDRVGGHIPASLAA